MSESHAFKSYERFTVTTSHIHTITEPMIPPCPASIESIFSMLFNVKSIRTHFVATQMCDFVWYLRRFFSTAKTRSRFKRNMKTYVIGHGEHDGMCGISIWNISDFSSVWQLRPSNPPWHNWPNKSNSTFAWKLLLHTSSSINLPTRICVCLEILSSGCVVVKLFSRFPYEVLKYREMRHSIVWTKYDEPMLPMTKYIHFMSTKTIFNWVLIIDVPFRLIK